MKGKKVTGFTSTDEAAAGITQVVSFLVEDMLVKNGGDSSKGADWKPYVVTDGKLIRGQTPASSAVAAHAVLSQLKSGSSKPA